MNVIEECKKESEYSSDFLFEKDAVNFPTEEIAARPMKYFKKKLYILFHRARLSGSLP